MSVEARPCATRRGEVGCQTWRALAALLVLVSVACIEPVAADRSPRRARRNTPALAFAQGQTVSVLPMREVHFLTPGQKAGHDSKMVVGPDASEIENDGAGWGQKVENPMPRLEKHVLAILAHHLGVSFAGGVDQAGVMGAGQQLPPGGESALVLRVIPHGYGLVVGGRAERAFLEAEILFDATGLGARTLVATKCELRGEPLDHASLKRESGAGLLDEQLIRLRHKCLRAFEEELCRQNTPDVPLETCVAGGYSDPDEDV